MAALGPTLNSTPLLGSEPPILEQWERLEEGRYVGKLQGRTVWLDVSLEVSNAQTTHGWGDSFIVHWEESKPSLKIRIKFII